MAKPVKTPTDSRRQRLLVLVLGALLLFYAYRQIGGLFDGGREGLLGSPPNFDFSGLLDTEVESLALSRLSAEAQEVSVGRSPWEYGKAPLPVRVEPPPRAVAPLNQPRPEPPAPISTAPSRPIPPAVDVEFLGSFGPANRKVAVFGKGDLVINALVGDLVNKKFRVHAIGLESVDLTFEGFPDTPPKRIPLK